MKKQFIALLLTACFLCASFFSACSAPHDHQFSSEWTFDETHHWHGCAVENCNEQDQRAEHTFEWVTDQEATTQAAGVKHEECSVCGMKKNENTTIDKIQLAKGEVTKETFNSTLSLDNINAYVLTASISFEETLEDGTSVTQEQKEVFKVKGNIMSLSPATEPDASYYYEFLEDKTFHYVEDTFFADVSDVYFRMTIPAEEMEEVLAFYYSKIYGEYAPLLTFDRFTFADGVYTATVTSPELDSDSVHITARFDDDKPISLLISFENDEGSFSYEFTRFNDVSLTLPATYIDYINLSVYGDTEWSKFFRFENVTISGSMRSEASIPGYGTFSDSMPYVTAKFDGEKRYEHYLMDEGYTYLYDGKTFFVNGEATGNNAQLSTLADIARLAFLESSFKKQSDTTFVATNLSFFQQPMDKIVITVSDGKLSKIAASYKSTLEDGITMTGTLEFVFTNYGTTTVS